MTIPNNLAGVGTGTFSLCPPNRQEINININLTDFTPTNAGAATGVHIGPLETIVAAEYFIDNDPGVGNGTPIAITAGDEVIDSFTLNVTGLSSGLHNLYIRGMNNAGSWGFYGSATVTILAADAAIDTVLHIPADSCSITNQETVNVVVKNNGANAIPADSAQVYLSVEGVNSGIYGPVSNTYPILPGDQATLTISNVNLSMPGTNTVTATLSLSLDDPADNSLAIQVIGTSNPIPTVQPVYDQTVCAGAMTASITFTGNIPGATYSWTNNNTAIGLSSNGTGNIPAFTTLNVGSVPLVAHPSNDV